MIPRPLVFLDIETTGASARTSRVLEVGALRVENGEVVGRYSQLVNPEEPVNGFITRLTGITDTDVADAPVFADIADELAALLDGAIFVAHNVNFDYSFIQAEYRALQRRFGMDRLCTVRLSRALYPEQKSHRLDEVIRIHGYEVANRHRAYDDAEILYRFYRDHLDKHGDDLYRLMNRLIQPSRLTA